jgi:pimeloyl-ACP methyl ester carboxylesterase
MADAGAMVQECLWLRRDAGRAGLSPIPPYIDMTQPTTNHRVTDADDPAVTSSSSDLRSRRPSLRLTAAEAVAFIGRGPRFPLDQIVANAPKGDGHSVLVLPALLCGDRYTAYVRRFLTMIGYSVHGWNLGVNIGPTRRLLDGTTDRLIDLSDEHGPMSIIGFSMGGLFARWSALRMPDRVRHVITVCSPIHEPARNFWLPLDRFLGLWPGVDLHKLMEEVAQPLPVGGTFLFSRDDGLVNPAACWDASVPPDDNIEISGPHVLIARNPQVMSILAERLARR